ALVAARQREAYPELGSVSYPLPPDQAFERAVAVARDLGWTIVAAAPARIDRRADNGRARGRRDAQRIQGSKGSEG
ncbi:MAG: hypothetical protein O7I42_01385, partial [Alphaproteobacteria bacterium]|nr:hypothetical protein [Alphaproteobacteria bacterium]